ncbi:MAG TPA: type IX secretion system protein PorQ [Candidatus Kapabacteria bacterium]|nr:type IX secretion system protein PorQ [Candidatus Kapabacteria bacterium]
MSKLCVALCLGMVFTYTSSAQSRVFQFLQLNASARAAALSGAFNAVADDPNAVFFNPASLATIEKRKVGFTFLKHVLDINSGLATYADNGQSFGYWSGSVLFTSYGSFDRANNQGVVSGSFSGTDIAFMGTYSNYLDSTLSYGTTVKAIYSSIADANSMAIAVDAGILYRNVKSKLNIGFSILNIGAQLATYQGIRESLPLDARLGLSYRLRGLPLLVNVNLHHLTDETDNFFDRLSNFAVGGELYVGKAVQVRVGYDNAVRNAVNSDGQSSTAGFSGGVGIVTNKVNIDYGATVLFRSGTLHRIGVNLSL